jgi:hypothetical protein
MNEYKIKLSPYTNVIILADNATNAKEKAWEDIKDGYKYGYRDKSDFMQMVKVQIIK